MIDPKELRPGNFIEHVESWRCKGVKYPLVTITTLVKVTRISSTHITAIDNKGKRFYSRFSSYKPYELEFDKGQQAILVTKNERHECKIAHEVQNFYFKYKGEELPPHFGFLLPIKKPGINPA